MKKLSVGLGSMNLVAEIYDSDHPVQEIVICLEEKESGAMIQNIAIIRQAIGENTKVPLNTVECLVYADSTDENFTDKFIIDFAKDYEVF